MARKKKKLPKAAPKKQTARLSKKIRQQIKSNYRRERKGDYTGAALTYLNRVRGAAKARKIKKNARAEVSNVVIPKNSELYKILERVALQKGIPVADVIAKYPKVLADYMKRGRFTLIREIEYLIADIDTAANKVFIKSTVTGITKQITKTLAKQYLRRLKNKMIKLIHNIYPDILVRHYYDSYGDLYLTMPEPKEYRAIDNGEDMMYFIDRYYAKYILYNLREKR